MTKERGLLSQHAKDVLARRLMEAETPAKKRLRDLATRLQAAPVQTREPFAVPTPAAAMANAET